MPFATNEEIRIAHDVLLKGKKPFDAPRADIIKKNSSCYIQACPGSGKTTALLAKLIILANRMPLPDGKGVCVLTHTNVAIDEIKAKVGPKADMLFRYPNFFGTIQTFLHKYVTAAALHYFYGSQIAYVDNDVANAVMLKKYNQLDWDNKLKGYVYRQTLSREHIATDEEINAWGGVNAMTAAKVIKKKGPRSSKYLFQLNKYDFANVPKAVQKLIRLKSKSIIDKEEREIILNSWVDWPNNKVIINQREIGIASDSGREYIRIKEEMFQEGILSFDDAYDLAFKYIQEKELDFSDFSDKRFQYLFVDEVQDCDQKQVTLIKKLFDDNKVIVQRFGDYCQAIFDEEGNDGEENGELRGDDILYIRNSNRFGEKIARPLRTLCMEDNSGLVGNEDVPSVKPIIITYNDPLSVLPKFDELLRNTLIPEEDNISVIEKANKEKEADPLHRINVKACGWVGRKSADDRKRFIESYFPSFAKKNAKTRIEDDLFDNFIPHNPQVSVKEYASSIIQGILKFLDLCEVKNGDKRHTRTSLLDFLKNNSNKKEEFLNRVMSWAMNFAKSNTEEEKQNVKNDLCQYLTNVMLPLFEKNVTEEANRFFNARAVVGQGGEGLENGNIYHGNGIDIEVATVHSVKGETHVATLYLETFFDGEHESSRLQEQFKGNAYAGVDEDIIRNLKVVYVGMSRPRYLLCVAIQKDRFDAMDCDELREIWDVEEA